MAKLAFVIPRKVLIDSDFIPEDISGKSMYTKLRGLKDLEKLSMLAQNYGLSRERGGANDVEHDASVQQLIVYGFIQLHDGRFMLYQRGADNYTESRLAGKVSLGIGGHMEPTDSSLMDSFYRELEEEIAIEVDGKPVGFRKPDGTIDVALMQQYITVEPVGIIKDEREEVGIVHLGIACRLTPIKDNLNATIQPEDGQNVRSFFVTPKEYIALTKSGEIVTEGWTDIVFREEILNRSN
jgi:predicted NUDIX family phosphoesterase